MTRIRALLLTVALLLTACAGGPPEVPYPVFVDSNELEDVFLASLPGVRAKQLAGDPMTRRTSNRIDLPADWQGTSGGTPGRSMELFVLAGALRLADIELGPGGYAFLPAGSLGFNLHTATGAQILYFLNDVDPESIIRSPIIIDSRLLSWEASPTVGVSTRELRSDPGNGARTWLLRVMPGASIPWQVSSTLREGYLVGGNYQHSECVAGEIRTWTYLPGGYFLRPPGAINGGPDSMAISESVWVLRERSTGVDREAEGCE